MSDSERWAWWIVGVVALTAVAYGSMFAFFGHGPWSIAAFAVLALTAVPASSRRRFRGRRFDERESEIASKAQRTGFGACWVVAVTLVLGMWFLKGWDAVLRVPVWTLMEWLQFAYMLILAVEATATIALCRKGSDA